MYCPECSQEKESKGIGLCGECYQALEKKLKNLSKRHADLFENSLSMQAKLKKAEILNKTIGDQNSALAQQVDDLQVLYNDLKKKTEKRIKELEGKNE